MIIIVYNALIFIRNTFGANATMSCLSSRNVGVEIINFTIAVGRINETRYFRSVQVVVQYYCIVIFYD